MIKGCPSQKGCMSLSGAYPPLLSISPPGLGRAVVRKGENDVYHDPAHDDQQRHPGGVPRLSMLSRGHCVKLPGCAGQALLDA